MTLRSIFKERIIFADKKNNKYPRLWAWYVKFWPDLLETYRSSHQSDIIIIWKWTLIPVFELLVAQQVKKQDPSPLKRKKQGTVDVHLEIYHRWLELKQSCFSLYISFTRKLLKNIQWRPTLTFKFIYFEEMFFS